eukprot:TCALIF_08099-PA protein Name:"Protein of unknown function" AED:0.29 eAED:0.29 QI:0/1/0/1/1/0/2/0/126
MAKRLQSDIQTFKAQSNPSPKPRPTTVTQELFQDLKRPMDHPSFITSLEDEGNDSLVYPTIKPARNPTFKTTQTPTSLMTSPTSSVSAIPEEVRSVNNYKCQPFWKLNGQIHTYCSIPMEMGFCLC